MMIDIEGVYDMEWLGKGKGKGNQCRTPESGESFFPYRDLETAKLGKEEPGDRSERTLGKTCRPMLDLYGIRNQISFTDGAPAIVELRNLLTDTDKTLSRSFLALAW